MTFLREIIELYLQQGNFLETLMLTLTKKMKNKALILKMQLITEQRVFVVKTYYKTSYCLEVKETFRRRFREADSSTNGQKGST